MDFDFVEFIRNACIFMPAFLLALVIHEYSHAWMANRFGDNTSEWNGRLTLNPSAHIDPLGSLLFPLASLAMGAGVLFGWAKPVPINPRLFSNYRKGLFWVAFVGPLSNIFMGFFTAFLLVAFSIFVPKDFMFYEGGLALLKSFLSLNFSLAVFNLIPVPPLDGSNMLLSFLGPAATIKFHDMQRYVGILFLLLMFTPVFRVLGVPIYFLMNLSVNLAVSVFGFALPHYSG
jgi:Zn-dependent protease